MSKKLCSILLAFAMLMLTITNAFAAVQFENVDGSTFKIENLKELGFISGYEDGSLRLDQYIKRSEFAKVLVHAFDKEQEAEAIKGKFKPFKDVDESHWANGIISIVKNLKGINNTQIINGYPDGTFRPEEHITNAEALKMLVCCVKADLTEEMYKNAEWFESWVKWAIELGIIGADSDVPNIADMNAKVTRGNVFTMFYNAFEEDEVERPIEKTEEKEPEKKTEDKKEEKSAAPDRHAGSRHDRYDRYPEYPYYPDLPIVPFEPQVPEVKTYSISIDSIENGIVSADKYSAEEGEIVNLRIMPNPGYKFDSIEVTDEFGNNVHVVNQWFAMPSSNVVVKAKFIEDTVKPVEFDKDNIKDIAINSEPSKMNYVEGEKLELSGFVVTLTDINDNTVEVPYNDFLEYGIDVEPVDGTEMTSEDNGKRITVSKSGIETKTNPVEVKELEYNDGLFESLEIINEPTSLSYTEKEKLDLTGLKVRLIDTNGKTKEVELKDFEDNGITTEPTDGVTLSLDNNGKAISVKKGTKTVETKQLTVTELPYNDDMFESLEIISEPEKLSYNEGDSLKLNGLKVRLTDTNGKTKEVELKDFEDNGITTEPTDGATLSLKNNGKAISVKKGEVTKTTTGKLEVTELTYDETKFASIEIISEPEKLSYNEGDSLELNGLKVRLKDTNGKTKEVELKDFSNYQIDTNLIEGAKLSLDENNKKIKVTKGQESKETTKALTVKENTPDNVVEIKVTKQPNKMEYNDEKDENAILSLEGMVVTLVYKNGFKKDIDFADERETDADYNKYIETSIEDRFTLNYYEHNKKMIIVYLKQNHNISATTDPLTITHFFTFKYKDVYSPYFTGVYPLEEKHEQGSEWNAPKSLAIIGRKGYKLIGWETEDGRPITTFTVNEDMVLVAQWRKDGLSEEEFLKERFEKAFKIAAENLKNKNRDSLKFEYANKILDITTNPYSLDISARNLISEVKNIIDNKFLVKYNNTSLSKDMSNDEILKLIVDDFAKNANVEVQGLNYSYNAQVEKVVQEILLKLGEQNEVINIKFTLQNDKATTTDDYTLKFHNFTAMTNEEKEKYETFFETNLERVMASVRQQGMEEVDLKTGKKVKIPVFDPSYNSESNLYKLDINTNYFDTPAAGTGGTGFKTAMVDFLTGGHVGENGIVQKDLQQVKITTLNKSIVVPREELEKIIHIDPLKKPKEALDLLESFIKVFMPEGKNIYSLTLEDLANQRAEFEYTYIDENQKKGVIKRTLEFGTFTTDKPRGK